MSDQQITKDTFPKASKTHAILNDFPEYLQNPDNYEKIMKSILDVGATRHSHGEVLEWAQCAECQKKAWERSEFMRQLGFKTAAHFKIWQRIHSTIKERVPLR